MITKQTTIILIIFTFQLQSIRTTFFTRKSKEPRPDDRKGAEEIHDDFELEALQNNEGDTPIVKNIDLSKPCADDDITETGKFFKILCSLKKVNRNIF